MLTTKKMFFIFLPALFLASLALFIRIVQFEPLQPKTTETNQENTDVNQFVIPISPDDPIVGNKKAPITIIAFEDFACPACQQQSIILDQLIATYPQKIKIIWKGLPVHEFPYPSEEAQKYSFCANKQGKFDTFRELAFTNGDNLSSSVLTSITGEIGLDSKDFDACIQSEAPTTYKTQNEQLAQILNIQAVPTYFVNNKQIPNPTTLEDWKLLLNL
jgi:protein-disulfide isomerase